MTARPVELTVTLAGDQVLVSADPGAAELSATGAVVGNNVRISLRGRGEFVLRFEGIEVHDVDVRGGYVFVVPGAPSSVRGHLDGWLSVTARRSSTRRRGHK